MTAEFVLSAAREEQFIQDGRGTAVFAGRSNVGKSSVINMLTGRKNLAKVGSTPGKTAHVNYFLIGGDAPRRPSGAADGGENALRPLSGFYFVDLPGYGYAKVSHAEKLRWAALLEAFFSKPERITLGILVADARHKPTALDGQMADLFRRAGAPFVTLANKSDKVKPSQTSSALALIRETLAVETVIPFSSQTGAGRREAMEEIYKRMEQG
ncbi:MAG: GTP-binding protein [Oscillospiraceae bacterium]|nr:GTP-binding protein [Oscillospiraceae bacterium]